MKVFQTNQADDLDELVTLLWELQTAGIVEESESIKAYFPDTADLSLLIRACHGRAFEISEESNEVPMFRGPESSEPILAGKRFAIVSSSCLAGLPEGRTCITIDAENAFGSGRHESTQLVIQALEEYLRPGSVVIDVGSGSGVLSAVACCLDAGIVVTCDTHLDSVFLTRQHAPQARVFAGSVDSIRSGSMEIVIANISARVIDTLALELNRIAKADGWLMLAGFIAEQVPRSFTPTVEFAMNEWRCWICKPQKDGAEHDERSSLSIQPFPGEWW